ncbi:sodium-dependent transporter [Natranaerovirga pectinivora]|nr:sodium-dependent transporter [Natranaerovirga pectinivora]
MSRERWSSRSIFILAAIGSAVGLGNTWRFPGQAYQNGGGAFLIPYFIALVTAGIPLLIMEIAIGKKFQAGAPTAFRKLGKKKGFEWLGWWPLATSFAIVAYYCIVMSWTFNYLWHSLTLAWTKSSSADFFYGDVLRLSDSPGNLGGLNMPLVIGLVLTWIFIWFSIRNGVKSMGKIVKWTVPLPIILLIILVIRALTLPGAIDGINYYLTPQWDRLKDINVWAAAYGQIFFSLSVLFGIMVAYASFLPKDSDVPTNSMIIAFADCLLSFVAGFAVFGTLGFLQQTSGTAIADMSITGPGLAFVTYPEAIAQLPGGLWIQVVFAFLFFLMLLTLGIDSAFSIVEGIVTGLVDKFGWDKKKTVAGMCFVGFAAGLIFATNAGLYWLDIVDNWVNNFNLILIGVFECVVVGWIYSAKKLRNEFNEDSNMKFGPWWDFMIKYVTPLSLLGLNILFLIDSFKANYEGYATKHLLIGGWGIVLATIVFGFVFTTLKGKDLEEEVN